MQIIIDTERTMKVIELIVEKLAYGWSPEELHLQHPYLTLGQIYSALAYYFDHEAELDRDIEKRLETVDTRSCLLWEEKSRFAKLAQARRWHIYKNLIPRRSLSPSLTLFMLIYYESGQTR